MELIVYSIPIITVIVLLVWFRKETTWWEYLLVLLPSVILGFSVEFLMKEWNIDDVEYLGSYVTQIRYYEPWNEYIHRTCTREVACGRDKDGNTIYRTETYDCSYVEEHPARWTYKTNTDNSEEYFYNKEEFDMVLRKLQVRPQFIDMHRHYYTKDGDCYAYDYDGNLDHMFTMTQSHHYENYTKSNHSLFKFDDISESEAKKNGLFDYPEIVRYDQSPVLGYAVDAKTDARFRQINAIYGKKNQFRLYVLVFKDKPNDVYTMQRDYWQNGNKNEMVICIGYDTKKDDISWCKGFSWCDEPYLEVKSAQWFLSKNKLDLNGYADFVEPLIKDFWKRKEFKDFSYIEVSLTDTQLTWLFIIILIYNIGISIWVVLNEFHNDEQTIYGRKPKYYNGYRYY